MKIILNGLVLIVSFLHTWFFILEMFLWKKPIGLKIFQNTPEKAELTAVLAANQGLYNAFLAAGLITSFFLKNPEGAYTFRVFFLSCVALAGLYGAWSVSGKILWIQFLPAALALIGTFLCASNLSQSSN